MKKNTYLLFFVLFFNGCTYHEVHQATMQPYIKERDHIIIDKTKKKSYSYGDVVICQFENREDEFYILRIAALPEDSLSIENHTCIINGKKNPYRQTTDSITYYYGETLMYAYEVCEEFPNGKKVTLYIEKDVEANKKETGVEIYLPEASISSVYIPKNHYYVLGDTRARAFDSRLFGPVAKENIKGYVTKVISAKKQQFSH